jgi:hypothetical protein
MKSSQMKHLAFYAGAISFVLGLFTVVSTYGEAHLKTAQGIEGNYLLALPLSASCGGGTPVTLTLQQSGVYVAAALANPALPRNRTAFKPMTLSGQWRKQQLSLAGMVPVGVLCANAKNKAAIAVKIEGAIATQPSSTSPQSSNNSATLTGSLFLNSVRSPLAAQRQPLSKNQSLTH